MKRSGPPRRRTPLRRTPLDRARSSLLTNGKPLPKRSRKQARRVVEYVGVRAEVMEAAGWRCQVRRSPDCTGRAEHAHHRLPRSGGGLDTVENLLAVCEPDHRWIHDHPAASYEAGWLLRRSA